MVFVALLGVLDEAVDFVSVAVFGSAYSPHQALAAKKKKKKKKKKVRGGKRRGNARLFRNNNNILAQLGLNQAIDPFSGNVNFVNPLAFGLGGAFGGLANPAGLASGLGQLGQLGGLNPTGFQTLGIDPRTGRLVAVLPQGGGLGAFNGGGIYGGTGGFNPAFAGAGFPGGFPGGQGGFPGGFPGGQGGFPGGFPGDQGGFPGGQGALVSAGGVQPGTTFVQGPNGAIIAPTVGQLDNGVFNQQLMRDIRAYNSGQRPVPSEALAQAVSRQQPMAASGRPIAQ